MADQPDFTLSTEEEVVRLRALLDKAQYFIEKSIEDKKKLKLAFEHLNQSLKDRDERLAFFGGLKKLEGVTASTDGGATDGGAAAQSEKPVGCTLPEHASLHTQLEDLKRQLLEVKAERDELLEGCIETAVLKKDVKADTDDDQPPSSPRARATGREYKPKSAPEVEEKPIGKVAFNGKGSPATRSARDVGKLHAEWPPRK